MRQAISTSMLTVPSMGNCTSDQMIAMTSKVRLAWTRLVTKPTATAEMANRKKNDEPMRPNCSGFSFSSAMIGWAASPTTTLSAKFTSMKRKSRAVMPHAPLSGRSCTVTKFSPQPSRSLRQAAMAKKRAPRGALFDRCMKISALDQRALAVLERTEGLVARHGGEQLVDVVLALRLGGRLDLEQVHVADDAAVLAQLAVLGHDVVDRHLAHLRHHRLGVVGAGGLHGLEIVQGGTVDAGGQHARQLVLLGAIALGPGARLVVHVPVEGLGQHQALRDRQGERLNVGGEHQQACQLLAALDDTELARLLDRVDRVLAGVGETDDLGLRRLGLQQERGEVLRREGRPDGAQYLAAGRLHDLGDVALEGMAEGVVGGDEEPAVAARLHHRLAGDVRQRDRK